jgi:hypothetical protein
VYPEIEVDIVNVPVDPESVTEDPSETELVPEELRTVLVVPVAVFNPLVNVEDAVRVPPEVLIEVVVDPDDPEETPEVFVRPEELSKAETVPVLDPLELMSPVDDIEDIALVPPEIEGDIVIVPLDPDRVTEDPPETELVPEELSKVTVVPVAVFNPLVNVEEAVTVLPEVVIEVAVDPDGPKDPPEVLVMPEELNLVEAVPVMVPLELIPTVVDIESPPLVPPEIMVVVLGDPVDPERVTDDPPETELVPEILSNVAVVPVFVAAELDKEGFNPLVNVEDDIKDTEE